MAASKADDIEAAAAAMQDEVDTNAVDESSDVDPEFATLQKTLSQQRRAAKDSQKEPRIQQVIPFTFAPNIRPLTISDHGSCVALENSAFVHPEHRATPEKLAYRLTVCPELCLGLFCTVVPDQLKGWEIETLATARKVETDRADNAVSVMLAHVVSTLCKGDVISDEDMEIPGDWAKPDRKPCNVGHQKSGRTVALHCLAVAPRVQGCGVGQMIMKAYLQQINNSGIADRVALICQDYLVSFYEKIGFKHGGASKASFGGGGWHDMIFELPGPSKTLS